MKLPGYYLPFTVFFTGAAILIIEILGARIISPYFGVSLYVWSSLITVALVSLAIGYWRGGAIVDVSPDAEKLFSIIFQSAVYAAFIPLVKSFVLIKLSGLGLRLGSFMSAAVLFGYPLILLGMATPYAVRLVVRDVKDVGKTTGALYAISTVGSFAGAIATGFIFIPMFSVDKIVYILSIALCILVIIPWILNRMIIKIIIAVVLMAICAFLLLLPSESGKSGKLKVLFKKESPYSEIKVIEDGNGRSLLIGGIVHGQADRVGNPANDYYYFVDSMIQAYRPDAADCLELGLGIGALPKILKKRGIRVDAVEIDPVVVDVAKKFFGFDDRTSEIFIGDARNVMENSSRIYDHIFLDAYAAEVLPCHLFTIEAFSAIKKSLRKDGILTVNFHDYSDLHDAVSTRSMYKTLSTVFDNVLVFQVQKWHDSRFRNIVFIASASGLKHENPVFTHRPEGINLEGNEFVFTDSFNPIDVMYNPVSEALRKSTLEYQRSVFFN